MHHNLYHGTVPPYYGDIRQFHSPSPAYPRYGIGPLGAGLLGLGIGFLGGQMLGHGYGYPGIGYGYPGIGYGYPGIGYGAYGYPGFY